MLLPQCIKFARALIFLLSFVAVQTIPAFANERASSDEEDQKTLQEMRKVWPLFEGIQSRRDLDVHDIMAMGQMGGTLYPNAEVMKKESTGRVHPSSFSWQALTSSDRDDERFELSPSVDVRSSNIEDENYLFGIAMEKWNVHEYGEAYDMLGDYLRTYPDGIWAGEARLHQGCDARFKGRYREAGEHFEFLLNRYSKEKFVGSRLVAEKAKSRLAVLRMMENSPDKAAELFSELAEHAIDPRQRTYAQNWILRLSQMRRSGAALADCGTRALSEIVANNGDTKAADELRQLKPDSEFGFSLKQLQDIASDYGYKTTALNMGVKDLHKAPLPAIAQVDRSEVQGSGHYWIVEEATPEQVVVYDEQARRRFRQSVNEFEKEWGGNLLVFNQSGQSLPGRELSDLVASQVFGGCCGVQAPEDDLGKPEQPSEDDDKCDQGCPEWSVNQLNLNLFVSDTPLWYGTPYGPDVKIKLSYNSQSAIGANEIFGNRWVFNYSSYVVEDPGQKTTLFMPDGKRIRYITHSSGVYVSPYGDDEVFEKLPNGRFVLTLKEGTQYTYGSPAGTNSQQAFLLKITAVDGYALNFGYDSQGRLSSITDAQNRQTTLTYNANNRVSQITDPFGRTANFAYQNSQLTGITDMGGYTSTLTYNDYLSKIDKPVVGTWLFKIEPSVRTSNNTVIYPAPDGPMWENYRVTVTDPLNRKTEYYYDGYHGTTWVVKPKDYVTYQSQEVNNYKSAVKSEYAIVRTSSGEAQISEYKTPDGAVTKYTYDATGNKIEEIDPLGNKTTYTYNNARQKITMTEAVGTALARTTWYEYLSDKVSLPTKITYPALASGRHLEMVYTYNTQQQLLTKIQYEKTGNTVVSQRTETYQYNAFGQMTSYDGPLNGSSDSTQFTYHTCSLGAAYCGRMATITNALNQVTEFTEYTKSGLLAKKIEPSGLVATYTYDNLGRLLTETQSNASGQIPRTTTYTYHGVKAIESIQLPNGAKLTHHYNAAGDRIATTDNLNNRVDYTLDGNGNVTQTAVKNASGVISHQFQQAYDSLNRVISISNSQSQVKMQQQYDKNGNRINQMDALDYPTIQQFDAMNRLIAQIDANTKQTQFTYDTMDNLVKVTDPLNRDTTYEYNVFGERTKQISPDTGTTTYTYDAAANLRSKTDARNITVQYSYDLLNRLTQVSYPNSAENVTLTYDHAVTNGIGRLYQTQGPGGATQWHYNVYGDVISKNQLLDNVTLSTAYHYDAAGQLTQTNHPGPHSVSYTHNALGQITSVDVNSLGGVSQSLASNITYLPMGGHTDFIYGNGKPFSRTYDQDGRLMQHSVVGIQDLSYDYTARNLISNITDNSNNTKTQQFGYDRLSRLLSANSNYGLIEYSYDALGNRQSEIRNNSTATDFEYDTGRLTKVFGNYNGESIAWSTAATQYRGQNGLKLYVYCPRGGSPSSVYGTGIYTDDSSICGAAVHAGHITALNGGGVIVTIEPGQASYTGSTQHGVTSSSYGSWQGSFSVAAGLNAGPAIPTLSQATWNQAMLSHRGENNGEFYYLCPVNGSAKTIYGTGIYTDDSSVCTAAVHSGLFDLASDGVVTVTVKPGQATYSSSTQHGITSSSYGSWQGSFTVSDKVKTASWTDNATAYHGQLNDQYLHYCPPGGSAGTVNGSGHYRSDTSICTAGVHV